MLFTFLGVKYSSFVVSLTCALYAPMPAKKSVKRMSESDYKMVWCDEKEGTQLL